MAKKLLRGIDKSFADKFKESCLYKLYKEHDNELIIGVRNNYINIYYHCNSIARVYYTKKGLIRCYINSYFLGKKDIDTLTTEEEIKENIIDRYETIKVLCKPKDETSKDTYGKRKVTDEKIAQQKLFMLNNMNENSKWFCFDVEWKKAYKDKGLREDSRFSGRFDILAISKEAPHKIAFIELKYGDGAIGGNSGIVKHIYDYRMFAERAYFKAYKKEVVSIINSLNLLDKDVVPQCLQDLDVSQIDPTPYFYIAALDNKDDRVKRQMAKYLFDHPMWGLGTKNSTKNVQTEFSINVLKHSSCGINLTFLFSNQTNENIEINDIIEGFEEKIEQHK